MKSSGKKRLFLSGYESEIKISLILLIGFLLSLNFLSAYSLSKARIAQQNGFDARMKLALQNIKDNIKSNYMRLPDAVYLHDIINIADIDGIEIFDSLGNQLVKVSPNDIFPKDKQVIKSSIINNKDGGKIYNLFISGTNKEGINLKRLALYDTIFRIAGLVIGLLVAYYFIRSVLNPYRKIKKEASKLNLSQIDLSDTDGVEYAVKMFQEVIRELKQKESLLKAMYDNSEKRADSLARYNEYILGSISSGVVICDNQGVITRFNRAAEQIIGYNQQYSQGRHFKEVFGKKHHITKIFSEALNKNKIFSRTEFEITRNNKESLWIGLSSSLISDNDYNKVGAVVLLTDLTKIKKLQEVSDFTEKMAALGEMSAGLAHELRNSVAAILGFGKLLRKKLSAEDKASSIVQMIISESLATEEMLSRFLNFTRPLNVVPAQIQLIRLLHESIRIAIESNRDKKIDVSVDDRAKDVVFYGDQILLRNAFSNLLLNSCQAIADKGKIHIEIECDTDKKKVKVKISDTGKGIVKENLPKIFNPFFTTREKGTGLGLALVRKIITGHLGNIEVCSSEDMGTTFTISLPLENKDIDRENISGSIAGKNAPVPEVSN